MIKMTETLLIAFAFILLNNRCTDKDPKNQRKKIGNFFVEANFKGDSIIDGTAKFFNVDLNIVSIVAYTNGKKNGPAVNYYQNGKKKDSMYFVNDIKNGFEYTYDSFGQLYSINYQYYGLKMGPQLFLIKGKPSEYYYTDFNKEDLIVCKYDSDGSLNELASFTAKPGISKVVSDGKKMLDFFVYLPNPPTANIEYSVGITNDEKQDKHLFFVNNDRIFFDTLMPYPKKGWRYYVSAHFKSINGSINKIFIEGIQHSE